ncbi:MAG: pyridoxamine 5'-phosphate oxidase family protein [Acidimicrobiales bacterium]
MAPWSEVREDAPDLAEAVEARFRSAKHHVLATLRRDGSPRVSGTEVVLADDGSLQLGSMLGAMKAKDLQRDGRFALHAHPGDGSMTGGDAKVSGVAHEVPDHPDAVTSHLFRLDVHEVVLITIHPEGDRLVIESWRPGEGLRRVERY